MKKITLLSLVAFFFIYSNAQNKILNTGFEEDLSSYTVVENTANVLMRVANIQDVTTQTTAPVATATTITDGMWVKKSPNSGYIKGVVVTSDYQEGTSSLNLKINAGTTQTGLNNWYNNIALQKISSGLDNTKKYEATFWAKVDGTTNNVCEKVVVFITDNTAKVNITKTITLTGGTTWTEYKTPQFDLPAHISSNPTANFAVTYFGIGNPTTYNTENKTNYSGVLLDNISLAEISPTTSVENLATNLEYISTSTGIELREIEVGSQIYVFDLCGMTVYNKPAHTSNVSIPLSKGIYIVRAGASAVKVLVR